MMQHASAHDQIEAAFQLSGAFDWQRPYLEIRQVVLPLELLGVIEAGGADVNADNARLGPADRIFGGLPSSTSRNKDIQVRTVWPVRPEQMISDRWRFSSRHSSRARSRFSTGGGYG